MGNKSSAPSSPDYGSLITAGENAATGAYSVGTQQLNWARNAYSADKATNDQVVSANLQAMNANNANAAEDRSTYENTYKPLEDQQAADAASYDTPERRNQAMGAAQAGVAQQFEGARTAAQQQLEGFGIDPSSTRYAALDIGTRAQQAALEAAAGTTAGLQNDATARQVRADAINTGLGVNSQSAQEYGVGTTAGNQAVSSTLATTASGSNTMGTPVSYMGAGNQAVAAATGTLDSSYNNQIQGYNANQNASSGIGSALGLAGGIALSSIASNYLAEGGEVAPTNAGAIPTSGAPAAPQMPAGATPGGAIPTSASPSGGTQVDDVSARLTPGEFVVPLDVMKWKGEEFFQKTIQQARQQKQQAVAKPTVGPALQQPTAFASRPQQAIPQGASA